MADQPPATTPNPVPTPPPAATTGQQPDTGKQPPWGKPENFDPDKAWELIQNLRKEKGGESTEAAALKKQLDDLQAQQKAQTEALAKALGVKADEAPNPTDALADQIKSLQEQFAETSRKAAILELAANPGTDAEGNKLPAIPPEYHHLLTATEPEALAVQAKSVAELVALKAAQSQIPGFAESAGQGQSGGPTPPLPAQIAAAETELRGKTPGTPEYRAAAERVAALKSQQLAQLAQGSR